MERAATNWGHITCQAKVNNAPPHTAGGVPESRSAKDAENSNLEDAKSWHSCLIYSLHVSDTNLAKDYYSFLCIFLYRCTF